jgi:2-haloacid dehalogenase
LQRRSRPGSRFLTRSRPCALGCRYRLAVISNIDDDPFAATARQLAVPFDAVVTAEQARCYKPHRPIFEEALRRLGAEPVAHVAAGVTEIAPMRHLRCTTVWVRRNGRSARLLTPAPDLEVPDLHSLVLVTLLHERTRSG